MLFFNAVKDTLRVEDHPNLKFSDQGCAFLVPDGLQGCVYLDPLTHVAQNTQPVAYNSTLYWFSCDLCLYGYDIDKKRWFQSNSLQGKLPWSLMLDPRCLVRIPILLDLCNGKFLVIVALGSRELGMAILTISKGDSLEVTLQGAITLPVDESFSPFNPMEGMAI